MRGRPRKSEDELKQNGTYRKDRHANRVTGTKEGKIPKAPDDFDAEHKAKWKEVCNLLKLSDQLMAQDSDAIRAYVENSIMARKAWALIIQEGMIVSTTVRDSVVERANPAFRVYQDCQKILKGLYDQFGFTPYARQRLKMKEPVKSDPIAELLAKRN